MSVPITELGELALSQSFTASKHAQGYTLAETEDRFWRERVAEGVLRIVAVLLLVAGIAQWFLPRLALGGDAVVTKSVLVVAFIVTGLALYFFASRGFRHALRVDFVRRRVGIARLNASGRWLVRRDVPMDQIESMVVKRPTKDRPLAELQLRLKGRMGSVLGMRGATEEIETLHRRLCVDIRLTLRSGAVHPSRVRNGVMKSVRVFQTKRPPRKAA